MTKHKSLAPVGALPAAVVSWLAGLPCSHARHDRAQRFVDYWMRDSAGVGELERAWSKIERAALSEDALISLFLSIPDAPRAEPYPGILGRRDVDAGEERRRNNASRKHISELRASLSYEALQRYAADAAASGPGAVQAYRDLTGQVRELLTGLSALDRMLELIDPTAKVETKHYASPELAQKNYRRAVASLNRFLDKPQHAALSFIAAVNCPDYPVPRNTLSKIWRRSEDNGGISL